MGALPPMPSWQEAHPLVIHFPIVLLLIAPLFVLLGAMLRKEKSRIFLIAALILMFLGTVSLYVATETGQAAAGRQQLSPQISAVLLEHRALAAETRAIFTTVTAIFVLLLVLAFYFHLGSDELIPALPIAFLAFYALGIALLFSTAHHGGILVHRFGL